ncbi:uncharacterized protein [Haliotis asinina]|uniref:uncharacterized protein n=1 Tax=Haliotis asinina TaxID=109174 RepID=UPI00353244F7
MRSIFILISVGLGFVSCERLTPGRVNITCGTLKNNTATIYYFGDSITVSAFMPNGKSCVFKQDVAKATWSLEVALSGKSKKCVMTKMPHRRIYSIEVLSRRGSPVFETDEDEKFLMECNFETYKDETEQSLPLIDVKHPPKIVDTHEGKVSNSNYTVELVGMGGQKLKSAEVGLIVRLKVTMSPSRQEKGLGFMPVRCEVTTPDEKQASAILADGCGTGYPFDKKKGFQMIKMVGVSPPFRVFRLHPKKSVNFKCSFVTCKGDCIGSTCEAEDAALVRLKRAVDQPPVVVHASTGDRDVEGVGFQQPAGDLQMVAAEFLVLKDPSFEGAPVQTDWIPSPEDTRRQEAHRTASQEARKHFTGNLPIRDEKADRADPRRVTIVHQGKSKIFTRNVKLAVLGTSGVVLLIFVVATLYLLSRLKNVQ